MISRKGAKKVIRQEKLCVFAPWRALREIRSRIELLNVQECGATDDAMKNQS